MFALPQDVAQLPGGQDSTQTVEQTGLLRVDFKTEAMQELVHVVQWKLICFAERCYHAEGSSVALQNFLAPFLVQADDAVCPS